MTSTSLLSFALRGSDVSGIYGSNNSESERIRNSARRFITEALRKDGERTITTLQDIAAFPVTAWILKALDINILTTRVVNLTRDILESELRSRKTSTEDVFSYATALGVYSSIDEGTGDFLMPVWQFIVLNTRISGPRYRLVNQAVSQGRVICSRDLMCKLIREAFVSKTFEYLSTIDRAEAQQILSGAGDLIQSLRELIEKTGLTKEVSLGSVESSIFPPCIKEYISQMQDGVNLPHMARFTLVSFLHKIGMDKENIMGLFRTAPDYNEKFTSYQVNHVIGETSSTEYSPPKCTVLQSNHLCYKGEDPVCNSAWLKHPIQYYTFRKRKSGKLPFDKLKKG
jgi:DNA primase large subunit